MRLGIRGFFIEHPGAADEGPQTLALDTPWKWEAERLDNGRHDVDERHHFLPPDASRGRIGVNDNQRSARGGLIQEQAVVELSMVAEAFAMISGEDDDGIRIESG